MTKSANSKNPIEYAAQWGSFMRSGDPGACMYGFSPEIGLKVQSEQHRMNCLDWIERCKQHVIDDPDNYDEDELDKLDWLRDLIEEASNLEKEALQA